jgi:hypothetical protein
MAHHLADFWLLSNFLEKMAEKKVLEKTKAEQSRIREEIESADDICARYFSLIARSRRLESEAKEKRTLAQKMREDFPWLSNVLGESHKLAKKRARSGTEEEKEVAEEEAPAGFLGTKGLQAKSKATQRKAALESNLRRLKRRKHEDPEVPQ